MSLVLKWEDIKGNEYSLGLLDKKENKYIFILKEEEYKKALKNGCAGIGLLGIESQESNELFQFFRERIPGKESPRLNLFMGMFGLEEYDEMELLKRSEARVTTDRFFVEEI